MTNTASRACAIRVRAGGLLLIGAMGLSCADAACGEAEAAVESNDPALPMLVLPEALTEDIVAPEPLIEPKFPPGLGAPAIAADEYLPEPALDGPIVCLEDPLLSPNKPAHDEPAVPEILRYGYDPVSGRIAWLPGDGDDLGIVSLENVATLGWNATSGVVAGFGVHFLDGPVRTELPARLYDFTVGYHRREWIRTNFGWDFVFRVGAFSDFEGSAKDGVRFPSHLVTMVKLRPSLTWLLGIDYLDRDDITLLPVVGAVWTPTDYLRLDLAFPRPRASMRIMDTNTWLYTAGELGGGTWAIERERSINDNATYRDLRLIFGIESFAAGASSALELGYVFARELEYGSALSEYSPSDCLMIAVVTRY